MGQGLWQDANLHAIPYFDCQRLERKKESVPFSLFSHWCRTQSTTVPDPSLCLVPISVLSRMHDTRPDRRNLRYDIPLCILHCVLSSLHKEGDKNEFTEFLLTVYTTPTTSNSILPRLTLSNLREGQKGVLSYRKLRNRFVLGIGTPCFGSLSTKGHRESMPRSPRVRHLCGRRGPSRGLWTPWATVTYTPRRRRDDG